MKALDEYKQKKFKTKNVVPDCREAEAYLNGLDEGWEAALKCVLNNIDIRCTRTIDVQRFIEEELEIWEE